MMAQKSEAGLLIGYKYCSEIPRLPDEDLAALLRALCAFRLTGERDGGELSLAASIIFNLMADEIADNVESYDRKCQQNSANAKKRRKANADESAAEYATASDRSCGDEPSERSQATASDGKRRQATATSDATVASDRRGIEKKGIEGNRKEEKGESTPQTPQGGNAADAAAPAPAKPAKQARFKKPTVEEVAAYAAERGSPQFNAQHFIDYYESNGWRVGRNPMKSWKAAVGTWLARDGDSGAPGNQAASPRSRPNDPYTDWSADIEAVKRLTEGT